MLSLQRCAARKIVHTCNLGPPFDFTLSLISPRLKFGTLKETKITLIIRLNDGCNYTDVEEENEKIFGFLPKHIRLIIRKERFHVSLESKMIFVFGAIEHVRLNRYLNWMTLGSTCNCLRMAEQQGFPLKALSSLCDAEEIIAWYDRQIKEGVPSHDAIGHFCNIFDKKNMGRYWKTEGMLTKKKLPEEGVWEGILSGWENQMVDTTLEEHIKAFILRRRCGDVVKGGVWNGKEEDDKCVLDGMLKVPWRFRNVYKIEHCVYKDQDEIEFSHSK